MQMPLNPKHGEGCASRRDAAVGITEQNTQTQAAGESETHRGGGDQNPGLCDAVDLHHDGKGSIHCNGVAATRHHDSGQTSTRNPPHYVRTPGPRKNNRGALTELSWCADHGKEPQVRSPLCLPTASLFSRADAKSPTRPPARTSALRLLRSHPPRSPTATVLLAAQSPGGVDGATAVEAAARTNPHSEH